MFTMPPGAEVDESIDVNELFLSNTAWSPRGLAGVERRAATASFEAAAALGGWLRTTRASSSGRLRPPTWMRWKQTQTTCATRRRPTPSTSWPL